MTHSGHRIARAGAGLAARVFPVCRRSWKCSPETQRAVQAVRHLVPVRKFERWSTPRLAPVNQSVRRWIGEPGQVVDQVWHDQGGEADRPDPGAGLGGAKYQGRFGQFAVRVGTLTVRAGASSSRRRRPPKASAVVVFSMS